MGVAASRPDPNRTPEGTCGCGCARPPGAPADWAGFLVAQPPSCAPPIPELVVRTSSSVLRMDRTRASSLDRPTTLYDGHARPVASFEESGEGCARIRSRSTGAVVAELSSSRSKLHKGCDKGVALRLFGEEPEHYTVTGLNMGPSEVRVSEPSGRVVYEARFAARSPHRAKQWMLSATERGGGVAVVDADTTRLTLAAGADPIVAVGLMYAQILATESQREEPLHWLFDL